MASPNKMNRRRFIGTTPTASLAMTVVPHHVLGGPGFVAPSDKLNISYIGCGTQGMRGANLREWMKAADELNKMGLKSAKAGIPMGFHSHHLELEKINGVLIYDALMNQLDPGNEKMQLQGAVISIGYKASTCFNKYPGRFISAHLANWSASEQKSVSIGI